MMVCWIWIGICAGGLIIHAANPYPEAKPAESGETAREDTSPPEAQLKENPAWQLFSLGIGVLCLHGVAFIAIASLLRQSQTTWRSAFGFDQPGLTGALKLAAQVAAAAVPVGMLIVIACGLLMQSAGMEPETQQTVQMVQEERSTFNLAALGVIAIIIAPVVEELLFRGIFYPTIKQQGHPTLAVIGVSLLFALSHANIMTFVPLTLLSIALIWLYEQTNNLLAPITTHALFNAANFLMIISGALPT